METEAPVEAENENVEFRIDQGIPDSYPIFDYGREASELKLKEIELEATTQDKIMLIYPATAIYPIPMGMALFQKNLLDVVRAFDEIKTVNRCLILNTDSNVHIIFYLQ
jgi:hypothetical protein